MSETVLSPSAPFSSLLYDHGDQVSLIDLLVMVLYIGAFLMIFILIISYPFTSMTNWFTAGGDHDDVEQGFSRPLEKGPSEMQECCIFSEISWAAFREKRDQEDGDTCTECSICLHEFKDEDQCGIRSKCNHIYHKQCIDPWLRKSTFCPLCRGSAR